MLLLPALVGGCVAAGSGAGGERGPDAWQVLDSGVDASLRGLSPVDARVCWASGSGGTVLRTVDGGRTWQRLPVAGGEELDFRDVEAFGESTAVIASAGQPARIYRTEDGGRSWQLGYQAPYRDAFLDSLAFADERRGYAFSDPVQGRFLLLETRDGGRSWRELPAAGLPEPLSGEAGFAASGTCLVARSPGYLWLGTGGAATPRVLRSEDGGRRWSAQAVPLRGGSASRGVFSIAFADPDHGVAVGGDYQAPEETAGTAAWTDDGGLTWQSPARRPGGYRSCVAAVPGRPGTFVATGPSGTDWSEDGGRTWNPLAIGDTGWHAVAFAADGTGWASGSGGRLARRRW